MNSIILKSYVGVREEYTASAVAINPGSLLEMTSSGTVQVHSTASAPVLPMFAVEDELQGKDIDDAYAASAKISVWIPLRGDQVYGILADGENVAIGDFLESNGAGYLQKWVADSADSSGRSIENAAIVGVALEAVDLSGSSGTKTNDSLIGYNKRIKLRVI